MITLEFNVSHSTDFSLDELLYLQLNFGMFCNKNWDMRKTKKQNLYPTSIDNLNDIRIVLNV